MALGGRHGGGGSLLLDGALQQHQLLGQAGTGFHQHIMFKILTDPHLPERSTTFMLEGKD